MATHLADVELVAALADAVAPIIFCTVVAAITGMEDMNKVGKTGGFAKNEQILGLSRLVRPSPY